MRDDLVYFAHGKESGPWGTKIQALAKVAQRLGFEVESPDYSALMNPEERVKMLLDLNPRARRHLVLAGSSMGGYVSTVAAASLKVSGLFLLAPAFFLPGYAVQKFESQARLTAVVHGWQDELIPAEHAVRFAKEHQADLHLLSSDHRLVSVLPQIEQIFECFLDRVLNLA